ncbi:MAG: CBS domain-containing protein [Deltaproteobacteria bacterium]|nr:MAG: CBS domain-containing protein [Deltaproteobacteria bacterium]
MNRERSVRDCMSVEVFATQPHHTLDQALNMMLLNNITHLPVVNDDFQLMGIISDRDIRSVMDSPFLELSLEQSTAALRAHQVEEVMKVDPHVVHPETSLLKAIQVMKDCQVGALPVVDLNNVVVGFLSRTDILDWVVGEMEDGEGRAQEDDVILLTQLKSQDTRANMKT